MARDMTSSSQSADARRTYQEPVARFLDYGECHLVGDGSADLGWLNYVSDLELTAEHVPELIRLACDAALHTAESEDPAVWAPTHAWRALGQLRAVEAVAPLLGLLRERADDDWVDIELPYVFGLIGPDAIPHVTDFLADQSVTTEPLITAIKCLVEIAERNPPFRNECIDILARRLKCGAENDPTVNGFLISALIDLEAIETIGVIRQAFDQQVVDLSIAGDVEDVEMEFGLRRQRSTPRPVYPSFFGNPLSDPAEVISGAITGRNAEASAGHRKVGRNDPCPCGSGKKYKKCCLQ
jgi:SEC-C motif